MIGAEAHRRKTLETWHTDKNFPVLILTVQDSAAGLNLQHANHIILGHPLLSYGDEKQAIGRAIRPGQKRNVTIWRFVVRDTLEEQLYQRNLVSRERGC